MLINNVLAIYEIEKKNTRYVLFICSKQIICELSPMVDWEIQPDASGKTTLQMTITERD